MHPKDSYTADQVVYALNNGRGHGAAGLRLVPQTTQQMLRREGVFVQLEEFAHDHPSLSYQMVIEAVTVAYQEQVFQAYLFWQTLRDRVGLTD